MRAAALLLTMACAAPALAQITRGGICGTVRDASGAVVSGAGVTATRVDTNVARRSVSDELGFYRTGALDPGVYVVRAELAGFTAAEARDIGVRSATDTTVDMVLKVAAVGEAITVTEQVAGVELNKTSPTVGFTTGARQVVELPLSADRSVNNLIALSANVVRTVGQGTYAVNGQRSRNNNYMVDGSDNNDVSVTISTVKVVPEGVAEFQVLTNPYSAEFGRNSGAQVNVVTRSGTNAFRGEAWDYYTTSELYSRSNLEKASGLTSPPRFNRNQVGAASEGRSSGTARSSSSSTSTTRSARGRRSGRPPGCPPGRPRRAPGRAARPRADAGQPRGRPAAPLLPAGRLRPGPDVPQPPADARQRDPDRDRRGERPLSAPSTWHNVLARVDHRLGGADNLTLRYLLDDRAFTNAVSNCTFGPVFCGNGTVRSSNLAGSEIHTFGPSMLNELRLSWVRREIEQVKNDPESPTASIEGLFTVGGASNYPQGRLDDAFQLSDTLTWEKGRHTLKAGVDVRHNRVRNRAAFNSKGTFYFNSLQDYVNNVAAYVGQALQTASYDATQWQTSFFVQDDLRATADLTLNLGLRYGCRRCRSACSAPPTPRAWPRGYPARPGGTPTTGRRAWASPGAPARAGACSATARRCCAAASGSATT